MKVFSICYPEVSPVIDCAMMTPKQLACALPKAELHLHLEGTLEPELMFKLARRNAVQIPFASVEEVRAAYQFSRLQDFLKIYYEGMSVLRTQADFYDLTFAYLTRAAADNVRHVEVFFDPQGHTSRGVEFGTVVRGIVQALREAEQRWGMSSKLILCFLRHLPEDDAFNTWRQAQPFLQHFVAVGLDSSELGFPPANFHKVFAAARSAGLKVVAHAGEEGPPDYIWQALDLLKIDRLDHGNRALEDKQLVMRLRNANMTLTVCPLSNVKLCVVKSMPEHPLRRMLQLGLRATVNSDDPAYFGGYINDNFAAVVDALELTRDEVIALARNSFLGSFVTADECARCLAEIDRCLLPAYQPAAP
jgi:adenosine deaminase